MPPEQDPNNEEGGWCVVRILTSPNSCSRAAAVTDATSDVLAENVGSATSVLVAAKQLLEAHQHHRQHQRQK